MKKTSHIISGMAIFMVAMSFSSQTRVIPKSKFTINFKHCAGSQLLKLDSVLYKNELGQAFTVSNFKYYISNIRLKNKSGKDHISGESFLINEEDDKRQIVLNNVAEGSYTAIEFIIGVDSLHNCSGAQSGALDPVNAMFWAWNTGYIFLKLEGKSPVSKSPGKLFEFHIGGYKQPNNCIRKISLALDASANLNVINIKADILELFKSPRTIDLGELSSVTDFHNATTIADNYSDMFSVLSANEK